MIKRFNEPAITILGDIISRVERILIRWLVVSSMVIIWENIINFLHFTWYCVYRITNCVLMAKIIYHILIPWLFGEKIYSSMDVSLNRLLFLIIRLFTMWSDASLANIKLLRHIQAWILSYYLSQKLIIKHQNYISVNNRYFE